MDKASLMESLSGSRATLFLPSPGTRGVVVRQKGGRRTTTVRRFAGSQAAMAWCESTQTALVYWHDQTRQN